VPRWLDFAGDAVLVAHNANFDVRFLNHEIARVFPGRRMANSNLCTVVLSRRIFPGLMNYRLQTVADHFSITINNRHRAASDALATAEIFIHMLSRLDEHGVRDLAAARRFNFNDCIDMHGNPREANKDGQNAQDLKAKVKAEG
jgi:DNA polymerase-3 subunit alpha (Gram-positive type)